MSTVDEIAKLIGEGVDIARHGKVVPPIADRADTPKHLSLDHFLWTAEEVEKTLLVGMRVERIMPDKERRFLKGFTAQHIETSKAEGDYPDPERFYKPTAQAYEISMWETCIWWLFHIKTMKYRQLMACVLVQKLHGATNINWNKVRGELGIINDVSNKALLLRYQRSLQKLADTLNESGEKRFRK